MHAAKNKSVRLLAWALGVGLGIYLCVALCAALQINKCF